MIRRPQPLFAGSVATARHARAGGGGRSVFPEAVDFVLLHWHALLLLFALGSPNVAGAADEQRTATEFSVKAAYLVKFASYIDWPPAAFSRPDAPFVIGVIGAVPIVAELNKIKGGVSAGGRTLEVRDLRPGEAINGIHLLYVGWSDVGRLGKQLATNFTLPVLTVTDAQGALESGSILNFVEVDNHIRFEVSLPHADRAGIKVSVRLLNVAHRIVTRKS